MTKIKMILKLGKKSLEDLRDIFLYDKTYRKYKEYTMIPRINFVDCLSLVSKYSNIGGCVVECGVWRGGMSAGMAEALGKDRDFYLFDSFEGLPPAKEIDGKTAVEWQSNIGSPTYFDNCKAEIDWARNAMVKSGAKNIHIVKGWFQETLPGYEFHKPIAILRLDGDWYDSIMVCLEYLFPKVISGGLIIFDDYYAWDGASRAIHEYLTKHSRPEKLISTRHFSACYMIKQ